MRQRRKRAPASSFGAERRSLRPAQRPYRSLCLATPAHQLRRALRQPPQYARQRSTCLAQDTRSNRQHSRAALQLPVSPLLVCSSTPQACQIRAYFSDLSQPLVSRLYYTTIIKKGARRNKFARVIRLPPNHRRSVVR